MLAPLRPLLEAAGTALRVQFPENTKLSQSSDHFGKWALESGEVVIASDGWNCPNHQIVNLAYRPGPSLFYRTAMQQLPFSDQSHCFHVETRH